MHPIIKSLFGIKEMPIQIENGIGGAKEHENYKRFKSTCELLGLSFREFNKGYQLRCANESKRFDYYPTTSRGSWTGSNKFFDIDSIENFLFINFKN